MHLINQTPFQMLAVPMTCQQDRNHLVIVVKATFDIEANRQLKISDVQQQLHLTDSYWGEAGQSSLRYETDLARIKPQADVAVIGSVYPAKGSATVVDSQVTFGSLRKTIRVFGDRYWEKRGSDYKATRPAAFESMPLNYENAYGGSYTNPHSELRTCDERNPTGKGYIEKGAEHIPDGCALPNLENPAGLITHVNDQPAPWSTGFVAKSWLPRRSLTGSYDSVWERDRNPLVPEDFDDRAHNAASAGLLVAQFPQGGERVELVNMSQQGPLSFNLPAARFKIESAVRGQRQQHQSVLDTITIEPDNNCVCCTWRSSFNIHWNLSMIEWIKVSFANRAHNL